LSLPKAALGSSNTLKFAEHRIHPYWSLFFEHMMVDQGGWSLREGGEVCLPYCGGEEERALGVGNEENPYNDTAHFLTYMHEYKSDDNSGMPPSFQE
jgi:hypothetical protein